MSASSSTTQSNKPTTDTSSSRKSECSNLGSPQVVLSPLIIETDFNRYSIRISLSDTEVEVRKQNYSNYGGFALTLPDSTNNQYSPPSSSRFQIVSNERNIALQKLILEDFELQSQSTDKETEDEVQEEEQISSIKSIETQYSNNEQQEASSKSKESSTERSPIEQIEILYSDSEEMQIFSPDYLVLNFLGCSDVRPSTSQGSTLRGDYYILLNIVPTSAVLHDLRSSVDSSKNSSETIPDSSSSERVSKEDQHPRYRWSQQDSKAKKMCPKNRIYPIEEISENSENISERLAHSARNAQEIKECLNKILKATSGQDKIIPEMSRSAWNEEYQLHTNSTPELPEDNVGLPNGIIESEPFRVIPSKQIFRKITTRCSSVRSFPIIPEIEVLEPNTSEAATPNYHPGKYKTTKWLRRLFKRKKASTHITIYKTDYCDICPECKCVTAYF